MAREIRLTAAQALIRYLTLQQVERDGITTPFFGGCAGIFGHGNLGGVGQALQEHPEFPYIQVKNEQAGVHLAVGYARLRNRLGCFACTSSVGPGATNMVTGAALATINRLPVLLLPGDIFARRSAPPVLQQLESELSQELSVNDCFRPVSRYWDRIGRPEQLIAALPEALRVLTSPSQTGAVTLCLPQDVQAEAARFPAALFEPRTWPVPRPRPDRTALAQAAALVRHARRPLIIAGGGVIYSEATAALDRFAQSTGIPVGLTQAGKGALPADHPCCLGGIGATGTPAANRLAHDADLVIGIGTRYSDFTTASATLFQSPSVRFINLNITEFDSAKQGALPLVGDAREGLTELAEAISGFRIRAGYRRRVARLRAEWLAERERLVQPQARPGQAEFIGTLNGLMAPDGVVINAAGSAPGDLHRLWKPGSPLGYHVEYGYSCMGYELPAALGARLAAPDRQVVALIGDGTWLMMNGELATAVQEGIKIIVLLIDNHGFASIGALSRAMGSGGFGTVYRRSGTSEPLPIDYVANAASLGAQVWRINSAEELRTVWPQAVAAPGPVVLVAKTDPEARLPSNGAWWEVPPAECSTMAEVQTARAAYEDNRRRQRRFPEVKR